MHIMDGDLDKAGEGAPELAKLLEEVAPAKTEVANTNGTSDHTTDEPTPVTNGPKVLEVR